MSCAQEELVAFHDAHFSQAAAANFGSQYLFPTDGTDNSIAPQDGGKYYNDQEYDDDGLGFYSDGVKRTLTDEQIAMFRHSELEALRRAEDKGQNKYSGQTKGPDLEGSEQLSEGEISSGTPAPTKKKSKNKRRRNNKHKPQTEGQQVDLRKRTWDVVETGLDSLDYGENEEGPSAAANPAQRRRISYDD